MNAIVKNSFVPWASGYHDPMRYILLSLALCLTPLVGWAASPPMTKLTIEVTDQAGKPVPNASLMGRFVKGHAAMKFGKSIRKEWELRTSQEGRVSIPPIPQGTILIQMIAK